MEEREEEGEKEEEQRQNHAVSPAARSGLSSPGCGIQPPGTPAGGGEGDLASRIAGRFFFFFAGRGYLDFAGPQS